MKNLAYFTDKMKFNTEELKKKSTALGVLIDVVIVFFIISLIAVSLRLVHDAFFSKQIHLGLINTAYAAESTDQAQIINQSHSYINIKPDTGFTLTLKMQNTGTVTWTKKDYYLKALPSSQHFYHAFWVDNFIPAYFQENEVKPGEYANFKFAVTSPSAYIYYDGEFVLVKNNVMVPCDRVKLTLNVVADPSNVPKPVVVAPPPAPTPTPTPVPAPTPIPLPSQPAVCSLNFRIANAMTGIETLDNVSCVEKFQLPNEGPVMRVGLFYTDKIISVKNTKAWQVKDQNDTLLASVPANLEINFFYNETTKQYSFDFIDQTITTASYLTLNNFSAGMYTITSYHDIPAYNKNIDYNDFIGNLEIRHNDSKDRTWVIEILPMERYLKGVQETTNYDPIEYLKTMSVAARTYASYHYDRASKHADEFFLVDATYDQVYRGYVSEILFPRVGEAVDATTGIVATYNEKIIVAPYFSHSDGRTRSFKEVWINEVPYLLSKPAPYSAGQTLFGHGVGIDAFDAKMRAKHDSWAYDQLLKYYYTGISLEKIW